MAKLEEISEMLVSEIRDFEEAVKKLEEIRKAKITIDVAELKRVLLDHQVEVKTQSTTFRNTLNQFESVFKEAKVYHKWTVIIFLISLLLNLVLIGVLLMNKGDFYL